MKMASKRREKELLLEYPLLGSFLCLQSGALRQLGRLGVGIRNKKTVALRVVEIIVPVVRPPSQKEGREYSIYGISRRRGSLKGVVTEKEAVSVAVAIGEGKASKV